MTHPEQVASLPKKEFLDKNTDQIAKDLLLFSEQVTIRDKYLNQILRERERQLNLPGSEFDMKLSHNDWIAIAVQYLGRASSRKHVPISNDEYKDSLIKSAAVILAALEHCK